MSKVYQATDVGRVRAGNEDSLAVIGGCLFVVADGMGGHAAGEVASRMLVETVRARFADALLQTEEALAEAVRAAHGRILEAVRAHPAYGGMGTTATLALLADGGLFWAHVGDSRLYLLHEGTLCQLTRDHSYVEGLVEQGELTEAEARRHPRRNMLMRAVGMEGALEVDTGSCQVAAGDAVLLATDGLMNMVSDEDIRDILMHGEGDKARALVEAALAAGGTDNVSVIVAEQPV